jgi:SAM-dependent methyltransferase
MEHFAYRHQRMRSQSPAQRQTKNAHHTKTMSTPHARPVSTFSTTSTLISNSSPEKKDHEKEHDVITELPETKTRQKPASSSTLQDIYQRHRHRSRSRKPEPIVEPIIELIVEPDDSSTDDGNIPDEVAAISKPKSFMYRHGRRYLADSNYMLPFDLQETQRQNLNIILMTTAFGGPICSPIDPLNPPRAILELGCGDGYWSSVCHDFFCCLNLPPPAFTGLDIAREGPNLRRFGIDWKFVNHDLSTSLLPFADESFDIVVANNMTPSLTEPQWWAMVPELYRIIKPGGYLEFRERDYTFRRMMPPHDLSAAPTMQDEMIAREIGCYHINEASEFTECLNKFLAQAGEWTKVLFERKGHHPAAVREFGAVEALPGWGKSNSKRIAIPLSKEAIWEKLPPAPQERREPQPHSTKLNAEQRAIRSMALDIAIGLIESLEPFLKRISRKTDEEWKRWWNAMVVNLFEENGGASGEVLEIGVCWCRKSLKV